jgi:hypothetical protein
MRIERLESRQHLFAGVADSQLFVIGTPGDDRISFRRDGSSLVVEVNSKQYTFDRRALQDVRRVSVYALAGADSVIMGQKLGLPAFIDAGGGNDTVAGSELDDTILGGGGNDLLDGRAGTDFLSGGDGDDTLLGHLGNDVTQGGAGNDTASATQIFFGGSVESIRFTQTGTTLNIPATGRVEIDSATNQVTYDLTSLDPSLTQRTVWLVGRFNNDSSRLIQFYTQRNEPALRPNESIVQFRNGTEPVATFDVISRTGKLTRTQRTLSPLIEQTTPVPFELDQRRLSLHQKDGRLIASVLYDRAPISLLLEAPDTTGPERSLNVAYLQKPSFPTVFLPTTQEIDVGTISAEPVTITINQPGRVSTRVINDPTSLPDAPTFAT